MKQRWVEISKPVCGLLDFSLGSDELLPAVDVVGCAREGRVGHDVHGERGDVGRFDDAPDGKRGAKLIAAVFEFIAEERADNGVSTNPAAMRLTRTGASSSARFFVMAGSAAVRAEMSARPGAVLRPPVPPMKSKVPPGRTLLAALRATCRGSRMWASRSRRAASKSNSASGA
jgi:hypothetical protein